MTTIMNTYFFPSRLCLKETICSPGLPLLIEIRVMAHEQEICSENTTTKAAVSSVFSFAGLFSCALGDVVTRMHLRVEAEVV